MKIFKLILIVSLTVLLVFGIGNHLLRRGLDQGLREMESKGLGTQSVRPLMQKITINLDGSPSPEIKPGFFQTFVQANEIGSILGRIRGSLPETSQELLDAKPGRRVDPWGHPFCFADLENRIAVISRGGNGNSAGCLEVRKEIGTAASMKTGFLYRSSKGTLIVVVPRDSAPSSENDQVGEEKADRRPHVLTRLREGAWRRHSTDSLFVKIEAPK